MIYYGLFLYVESTDKCKIKQSFCSTLLLMFHTFVFARCNVFFAVHSHLLVHPIFAVYINYQKNFSKVHLSLASVPNAHA